MARLEDVERMAAAREREEAAQRKEAVIRFGETLGKAYINYALGRPGTKEQDKQRTILADAIATALGSGNHEEMVQGIIALLSSFEAKIEPVTRKADDAHIRSALF